jgi:hypothetical protein
MAKSIWVPVFGYEYRYKASSAGKVFDRKTGRLSAVVKNKQGYLMVCLRSEDGNRSQIRIHRAVFCSFNKIDIKRKNGDLKMVCHKNDIKTDNRLENLYLGTAKQNGEDKARNGGRRLKGRNMGLDKNSILTRRQVILIRYYHRMGVAYNSMTKLCPGVTIGCIEAAGRGHTHKYIPMNV